VTSVEGLDREVPLKPTSVSGLLCIDLFRRPTLGRTRLSQERETLAARSARVEAGQSAWYPETLVIENSPPSFARPNRIGRDCEHNLPLASRAR
jgi:hypothetical protein